MQCCDNPKPRILEANGRVFCSSCRHYLDVRSDTRSATDLTKVNDDADVEPEGESEQLEAFLRPIK